MRSFLLSGWLLISGSAMSAQSTPAAAYIINSGSTNSAGFSVAVKKSGDATLTVNQRGRRGQSEAKTATIPGELIQRFYADLEAARPLAALPHKGCLKSVSFGTRLTIQYESDQSPDISCPQESDARVKALKQDADEILKLFPK